jgi:sulfatase maturation enzyme AslB (radical SAM superfamily)
MAFDKIQYAVDMIKNKENDKNITFSISTNGSLLDEAKLEFLNENKFSLLLSFDGLAQDFHRRKNSFDHMVKIIKNLLGFPDIELEVNSVFTPKTIEYLSKSVRLTAELGVPEINATLSQTSLWNRFDLLQYKRELQSLNDYMSSFYIKNGRIPFSKLRMDGKKGVFSCFAAKDRLAITANGKVWGCHLFADYFNGKERTEEYSKYCFGDLRSFVESPEKVYPDIFANYSGFRMDRFQTDDKNCADCKEMEECRVCPLDNRIQGSSFEKIPRWICEENKITRESRNTFWMKSV